MEHGGKEDKEDYTISFVFETAKINIELVTNTLPFLFTVWTSFQLRELIQKENDG